VEDVVKKAWNYLVRRAICVAYYFFRVGFIDERRRRRKLHRERDQAVGKLVRVSREWERGDAPSQQCIYRLEQTIARTEFLFAACAGGDPSSHYPE
jgi:hypothetical protein